MANGGLTKTSTGNLSESHLPPCRREGTCWLQMLEYSINEVLGAGGNKLVSSQSESLKQTGWEYWEKKKEHFKM